MSEYIDPARFEEDEEEIHLRDYLQVLRKRRGLILLVLLVVVATAAIMVFTAVPQYTASSQVMIEKNRGSRSLEYQYYEWDPGFLETQSEIIRSVNVGRRVVDSLDLAGRYRSFFLDKEEDGEPSLFGSLKKRVKETVKSVLSFATSSAPDRGEGNADAVIAAEPLSDENKIARMISAGLEVSPVKDTKIVSIGYSDKNPGMAQMITNAVVKAYMDEMLEIKLASSSYQLTWMTDKADQEREKLERSERALQKYMRDNDLVTVEDKLTVYPQRLSEFSSQLSQAEAERKEKEDLLAQIEAVGQDFDKLEKIPLFADSKVLTEVREEIYQANQKIKDLSKKFGPKHPVMIKANEDLKLLLGEKRFEIQRIVDATRNSYSLAASKEKNLRELLDETKGEVLNLNEKFIQYSVLKREVDANRLIYDTLQTNIKKENITEQTQSVSIWVIEKAELPTFPSKPNKKRTLMLAVVLGLFGGIGLAFLIEYLDNSVKSEAELEKHFGKTVLGSVEQIGKKESIETYIVKKPLSPLAESYRLIRSGLLLSSADQPPGTILVTSMGQNEGKTSTTINVARVLTQDEKKVLIIDCDLRRPRIHKLFRLENQTGLSTYLSGNIDEMAAAKVAEPNLSVITSGPVPPNPSELLSSKRMQKLLTEMDERFDFILLDSPPVQSVTDSLALASAVDGTIVVVQYGKTTYDMLNSGMKKLTDVNAQVLGFVVNGLKKGEAGAYYYGYSGYYKKYT